MVKKKVEPTTSTAVSTQICPEAPLNEAELRTLPDAETTVYLEPETVCGQDDRAKISPATAIPRAMDW